MRTNFRTRILTNVTEMRGIVSDWSNLHERCPKSTPFQSPEWILAWADAFSPEKMRVVEVRRGDMLVGLVPLLIFPRGDEDVLAFMAGGVSDYLDVVVDPRFACQACSAILEATAEIEGWTILDFTDLPATSVLHRTDLVQFKVPHDRCSSLKLPEAKQELLQVLSKRQRANLRNACSRLQRAGGGTFELASAETLPEFLEDLFRLHTDRWSQLGEAGVLADEKVRILHCQAQARNSRPLPVARERSHRRGAIHITWLRDRLLLLAGLRSGIRSSQPRHTADVLCSRKRDSERNAEVRFVARRRSIQEALAIRSGSDLSHPAASFGPEQSRTPTPIRCLI